MIESSYIEVISGQRQGPVAATLRGLLALAEPFYGAACYARNRLYDLQLTRPCRMDVPIISVGNITTGGTGKTPTVAWLVDWLLTRDEFPGILSRGYRSLDGDANDEKLLLDQLCPQVPHLQNRDRCTGARQLLSTNDCSVIVLDDGFQHRRLARDVDLVLIDALNPLGYGHLLPRGLLRESLKGLRRATAILLTRTDQVTAQRLAEIVQALLAFTDCPILSSCFNASGLVNSSGQKITFSAIHGQRSFAFAAIGNPGGFRRTLAGLGLAAGEQRFQQFSDHHHFTQADLLDLQQQAQAQAAEVFLCTRKDLVKLNVDQIGGIPVWAVDIELVLNNGDDALLTELLQERLNLRQSSE